MPLNACNYMFSSDLLFIVQSTIVVCMERAVLAIDKLKLLHDPSGWPALRQQMKHNILMQVVKEETKRAVQMEVDYAYEDTGMPYDFDKLIRFADRYERNHNCAPKEDVTTLFKVASGGIHRKESVWTTLIYNTFKKLGLF